MSEKEREQLQKAASVAVTEAMLAFRANAGWEPGDDLCPPWWPRRPRPPRGPLRSLATRADLLAADRVYTALTLMASATQFSDDALGREVTNLAIGHVREGAAVLARGASVAWDPDDGICPWPWWRGPGPHPWWTVGGVVIIDGVRGESNPMPGIATHLLDLLGLVQAYNVAAMITDTGARTAVTKAIGQTLATQVDRFGAKTAG